MGLFKGKSKEDGPAATDQATTLADEEETQNQEKNDDEYAETVVEQEISSKVRQSYNGAPAVAPAGIDDSKTRQILQKVDEATLVMEMNIAAAAERGENLDDLQVKTSMFNFL